MFKLSKVVRYFVSKNCALQMVWQALLGQKGEGMGSGNLHELIKIISNIIVDWHAPLTVILDILITTKQTKARYSLISYSA